MPASPLQQLLGYLEFQPTETFDLADRVDGRGYLARSFPAGLPLLLSRQAYPRYRRMVGENWMHWHDYYEFFLALSGHGRFRCGHERFAFRPGDIVLVEPLKIHGVLQMEATHTALVVLFPRHLVANPGASEIDEAYLAAWDQHAAEEPPVVTRDHAGAAAVHRALLDLARTWFDAAEGEKRNLRLKLELLATLLPLREAVPLAATGHPLSAARRKRREARLRQALDFMSRRLHEPFSQTEVAREVGMSVSRFRAFFKETTGWGFAHYVRDQRVERAAKLLRETGDSVASIACLTGFSDQSHLLRCFKEKYGRTPTAYRKQHAANEEPGPPPHQEGLAK